LTCIGKSAEMNLCVFKMTIKMWNIWSCSHNVIK